MSESAATSTGTPLRNIGLLAVAQAVVGSNQAVFGVVASLTALAMIEDTSLSTLPVAFMTIGTALATGALLSPETQAERLDGAPLEVGPPYDLYALGIGETDGWWGHNGEGLGFTAAVFHDPATAAIIAVFMNESNVEPKAHPADQLFRRIAAILSAS